MLMADDRVVEAGICRAFSRDLLQRLRVCSPYAGWRCASGPYAAAARRRLRLGWRGTGQHSACPTHLQDSTSRLGDKVEGKGDGSCETGQHPSTWISEGEHKPRQMIVACEVAVSRFATAKPVKASSASGADSDSEGSHPF